MDEKTENMKSQWDLLNELKKLENNPSFLFPNYEQTSIVNIISSIMKHFGVNMPYSPLAEELIPNGIENIVLLIVDGLGYYILKDLLHDSFLNKHNSRKFTSVFPSTTAAALTSFYTGMAPKNHGFTGWFTYFRELGIISLVPPLVLRSLNLPWTSKEPIRVLKEIVGLEPISALLEKKNRDVFFIHSHKFYQTPYQSYFGKESYSLTYGDDIGEALEHTYNLCKLVKGRKLIIIYYHLFDSEAHIHGVHSPQALAELEKIDKNIASFVEEKLPSLSSTALLLTADHGLIDIPKENVINLKDHTLLKNTLTLPLSGEPRVPYFYVKARRLNEFLRYIDKHFSNLGFLLPYDESIKIDLFGKGKEHPSFIDRIGDYLFLFKERYVIVEQIYGEPPLELKGFHGGLTKEEMTIPLISFVKE